MLAKLLEVDEYKKTYHKYLREIVDGYLNSGKFTETIETVDAMINEYVKNDPTAFYSYDKYTTAVETIKEFGVLRAKSIEGQLDGTIGVGRKLSGVYVVEVEEGKTGLELEFDSSFISGQKIVVKLN